MLNLVPRLKSDEAENEDILHREVVNSLILTKFRA